MYLSLINIKVKRIQLGEETQNGETVLSIGHDYYPLILYKPSNVID